ncbi:SHOCT-like domain-containing protein [Catellatospora vulcania]|uniref:SHOCT-like domain-containing protein n=1 Tax=Catellatospora vulcania TaxID=1460450 RepID=UPI0012D3C7B6
MNEQRRQVLQMLSEGKITAEEAERLIDALDRDRSPSPPAGGSTTKTRPKYLRVVVISDEGAGGDGAAGVSGGDGSARINIRVPLQLLRAGVKLASLVPPQALTRANAELRRSGVDIDLTQLKPQQLEELIEHLDELTVDIDSADAKVQVFCE